jgi:hypothetical protein
MDLRIGSLSYFLKEFVFCGNGECLVSVDHLLSEEIGVDLLVIALL